MPGDEYKKILHLLDEIRKTTDESNRILRKMRREALIGSVFKFVTWLIILGSPIVFYYYYKPTIDAYMTKMQEIYGIVMTTDIPRQ